MPPLTESPKPAEFCAAATAVSPPAFGPLPLPGPGPDPATLSKRRASAEVGSPRVPKRPKEDAAFASDAPVSAAAAVLAAASKPGADATEDDTSDDDDHWVNTDTVESAELESPIRGSTSATQTIDTTTPTAPVPEVLMVDNDSSEDESNSDPPPSAPIKVEREPVGAIATASIGTPPPAAAAAAAAAESSHTPLAPDADFRVTVSANITCCACADPIRYEYVTNENDTYGSISRDLKCTQDTLTELNPKHDLGGGRKFKKGTWLVLPHSDNELAKLSMSARGKVKAISRCPGCDDFYHASCQETALGEDANTVRLRTCGICDQPACWACVWTCAATENDGDGKDCNATTCRKCYLTSLNLTGEQGQAFWARIQRRTKDNDPTLRCQNCPAVCDVKFKGCNMDAVGGRSVICEGCDRSRCFTCAKQTEMTLPDSWFCNRIECRREKSRRGLEQRIKELKAVQANNSSSTAVVLPRVLLDGSQTSMTLGKYISLAKVIKPAKSDLLDIAVGLLEHLKDLHANGKVHARLQLSSIQIALEADTNCITGLTVSAGSPDEPLSWKFRAPELLLTEEAVTSKADMYSCGVVLSLLFALGGVVPYPNLRSSGPDDDGHWDEVYFLHPIVKIDKSNAQDEMVRVDVLRFVAQLRSKMEPSLGTPPDAGAVYAAVTSPIQPDQSGAAAAAEDLQPHRMTPPAWLSQHGDLAGLLRDSQNQKRGTRPPAAMIAAAARAALRSENEKTQSLQTQFFRSAARGGFRPRSLLNVQWSEQKCNQQLKLVQRFETWLQEHRYKSQEIPGLKLALVAAASQMLLPSLVALEGNPSDVIQPDSFLDRWLEAFDKSIDGSSETPLDRLGSIDPRTFEEFLERVLDSGDFTDGNFVVSAVAKGCPIAALVGQGGLHAKSASKKQKIVGLFGGKLEESRDGSTVNKLPTVLAAENQYSLTLLEVPKARSSAHDDMSEQLINCYPDKGNSTMMINNGSSTSGSNPDDDDCKQSQSQSQADPQSTPPEAELVNTGWLEIGYHGWPYNLVYLTRDVAAGEQLLVDYGAGYWNAKVRLENVQDSIETFSAEAIGQAPIS